MSRSPAPEPPPAPEWAPAVPTEGPLAGSRAASPAGPAMSPAPVAASPPRLRRILPIVIGLAIVAALGFAAKMTVFKSDAGPGEAEVDAAFSEIPGFTYTELPPESLEQAQEFIDGNEEAAEAISSFDIRQVNRSGLPVGAVIIFGVDPEVIGESFREGFTAGFQTTAGSVQLNQATVAGADVISVTMPQGAGKMFFDDQDGLIFFVQGNDEEVANEVTRGLIKGNL